MAGWRPVFDDSGGRLVYVFLQDAGLLWLEKYKKTDLDEKPEAAEEEETV